MRDDPILDEIHRFREEYAQQFNYDLNAICQDLRNRQQQNGHRVITLPPRRPAGWNESSSKTETIGLREEDWPDTPENRAEILRRMDAVEPLELTDKDEARIAATRAEMKAKSIEAMGQLMGLQP